MKRRMLVIALLALIMGSGCVQTSQEIIVGENGMAQVTFRAIGDKIMAGDELNLFAWQIQQMIPQLNSEYTRKQYTIRDGFDEYLVYEWKSRRKVPVTEIAGVSWYEDEQSYVFEMKIESVLDEVADETKNDVVMEIMIVLPKEIDMANSTDVQGNQVKWAITKGQLLSGLTLKAYSK